MSQTSEILSALKQGEVLTPLDILQRFGSFRASARIMEIRQMGYDVQNLEKSGTHAKYKLIQKQILPQARSNVGEQRLV